MTERKAESEQAMTGDIRARIIAVASKLVREGGVEAATTRAVASAAAVQAPTIYRLFGDKSGLLDAVAEETFAVYVASKVGQERSADPVEDLRRGWDTHVAFGLSNPAIFTLISTAYARSSSRAAAAGLAVLRQKVHRVAQAGKLRVSEERAADLIQSAATGTVLTLLERKQEEHAGLSQAARDAVFQAILTEKNTASSNSDASSYAVALRASLNDVDQLTPGERLLLNELLQRISR